MMPQHALSMLSCWGEGGGEGGEGGGRAIDGGFELRSVFLFKCPAPGKSFWVKKVQSPHTRGIIVGQKNSTNDQKSCLVMSNPPPMPGFPPPPQRLNIDRCIMLTVDTLAAINVVKSLGYDVRTLFGCVSNVSERICSLCSVIIQVMVVLKRTVVGD